MNVIVVGFWHFSSSVVEVLLGLIVKKLDLKAYSIRTPTNFQYLFYDFSGFLFLSFLGNLIKKHHF